jgi:hypothetical protein
MEFQYGQQSTKAYEPETLNRKLANLVKLVASAIVKLDLRGYDISIFMDNSTDEATISKGSSKLIWPSEVVLCVLAQT